MMEHVDRDADKNSGRPLVCGWICFFCLWLSRRNIRPYLPQAHEMHNSELFCHVDCERQVTEGFILAPSTWRTSEGIGVPCSIFVTHFVCIPLPCDVTFGESCSLIPCSPVLDETLVYLCFIMCVSVCPHSHTQTDTWAWLSLVLTQGDRVQREKPGSGAPPAGTTEP